MTMEVHFKIILLQTSHTVSLKIISGDCHVPAGMNHVDTKSFSAAGANLCQLRAEWVLVHTALCSKHV
jgi:hypothetical protein